MQGRKDYQPELFSYLDMEKLVSPNHLLRRIDRSVDLSFIRELTKDKYCNDNGRPSIDPEVYFRIQLVGYIYGISSERQLIEELQVNLAYRWFCRLSLTDEIPDHSSLTRIRDRLGKSVFEAVFCKIVNECKSAGLVAGKRAIVDATLVAADASLDTLERRDGEDEDNHFSSKGRALSNQTHVSRVDPDSALSSRPSGARHLCHKVHYVADAKKRIITAVAVSAGNIADYDLLPSQIDYCLKKQRLALSEVVADKGYGVGKTLEFLKNEGLRGYIPVMVDRQARHREFGFKYKRANNIIVCPEGKVFTPRSHDEKAHRTRYQTKGPDCRACNSQSICTARKASGTYSRILFRSDYEALFSDVRRRQVSAFFRQRSIERKWKIEGLFAEAKRFHRLYRAKYRGATKMHIQAYLTATVQNLKRLCAGLQQPKLLFEIFIEVFFPKPAHILLLHS